MFQSRRSLGHLFAAMIVVAVTALAGPAAADKCTDPPCGNAYGYGKDSNTDGGTTDGGTTGGGTTGGGTTDGGTTDGGTADGGSTDGGSNDGGTADGGTTATGELETSGGSTTSGDDGRKRRNRNRRAADERGPVAEAAVATTAEFVAVPQRFEGRSPSPTTGSGAPRTKPLRLATSRIPLRDDFRLGMTAIETFRFPLLLSLAVLLFLFVQDRVDRNDPKLANAREKKDFLAFN